MYTLNMKAVILVAGKGKRMGGLTEEKCKPLLPYMGRSLLVHKLEALPEEVSEIILIIGYLGEQIKKEVGDTFDGRKVRYVEQKELLGTAHALWQCREHLSEDFLVLMGDDIYTKTDLKTLVSGKEWKILAFDSDTHMSGGKIVLDEGNNLVDIQEDFTGEIPYTLVYTGACYLTPEIFDTEMVMLENGEYGLPQTIASCVGSREVKIVKTKDWTRITSPEDLGL